MAGLQHGPLVSSKMDIKHVDVEVFWNNKWYSLNDHFQYRLHPEGFGKQVITKRRKKVSSEFFSGEYVANEAENNVDHRLLVWVHGNTQFELVERIKFLETCFTQPSFSIRTTINESRSVATSSGSADITIDQSHVYMHALMALMEFTYATLPGDQLELIL